MSSSKFPSFKWFLLLLAAAISSTVIAGERSELKKKQTDREWCQSVLAQINQPFPVQIELAHKHSHLLRKHAAKIANRIIERPWFSLPFFRRFYPFDFDLGSFYERALEYEWNKEKPPIDWTQHRKRIWIVTHQSKSLVASTVDALKHSNAPLIVLVTDKFPFHGKDLYRRANSAYSSFGGEFERVVNADEVILVGGFLTICLRNTIEDLIRYSIEGTNRTQFEITLKSSLIYTRSLSDSRKIQTLERELDYRVTETVEAYRARLQERFSSLLPLRWKLVDSNLVRGTYYFLDPVGRSITIKVEK